MRDIKFRAFNKQCDCESCGGTFTSWERLLGIRYTTNPNQANNFFEDDDYVLEQFTGLLDKNGKEIYEGDILLYERVNWKCNGHPENGQTINNICEVYYCDIRAAYRSKMKEIKGGRTISTGDLVFDDSRADENNISVIGNIHENPELLEELV